MINTVFLLFALFPIALGLGFVLKPRKIKRIQAWFRKKMERCEMRLFKAHKRVGTLFMLFGFLMVYTYFQPIWIYNMFVIGRIVMGVLFPDAFQEVQRVNATPMVCI